jgi:hypothetical protein
MFANIIRNNPASDCLLLAVEIDFKLEVIWQAVTSGIVSAT